MYEYIFNAKYSWQVIPLESSYSLLSPCTCVHKHQYYYTHTEFKDRPKVKKMSKEKQLGKSGAELEIKTNLYLK